jgi:hypothetical protein
MPSATVRTAAAAKPRARPNDLTTDLAPRHTEIDRTSRQMSRGLDWFIRSSIQRHCRTCGRAEIAAVRPRALRVAAHVWFDTGCRHPTPQRARQPRIDDEFTARFAKAGFEMTHVVPTRSTLKVIEARPM